MADGDRLKEFVQYSELKQLAFNIAMLQQEKRFHSLAVLSFFPGEGKTLFCAAAAMAYADACRSRALIIDTTTLRNRGSLELRDCFSPPSPAVDIMTMEDIRKGFDDDSEPDSPRTEQRRQTVHEPDVVMSTGIKTVSGQGSDQNLLRVAAQAKSKSHGLILMDTAPLNSRNRNNVDPLVVARQSDASVLIISRKLLNAADVSKCLKIARDPTLRLIGIVSNEAFES